MKEELDFFKKNGYFILKNFIDKEDVIEVLKDSKNIFLRQFIDNSYTPKCELDDLSEEQFNGFLYRLFKDDINCLSNCGKQIQHLISLHLLSLNKKIIEQLHLFGLKTPIISTRPVLYFNHPKLAKQKVFYKVDAHQDWRSMQGSLNSMVIWIPLIDINKDLGALEIVPKSHLSGLKTEHFNNGFGMVSLSEQEKKDVLSVEVEVGDALLFSAFLIHQSGENITNKPRWSCHFRYNDLDEPTFIKRKFAHPYIYKPSEELITKDFPSLTEISKIYL